MSLRWPPSTTRRGATTMPSTRLRVQRRVATSSDRRACQASARGRPRAVPAERCGLPAVRCAEGRKRGGGAAPRAANRPRRVRTAELERRARNARAGRRAGLREAQGQLRALGAPADLASAPNWRRLAETVDVGAWLRAPAGETLHERPLVAASRSLRPTPCASGSAAARRAVAACLDLRSGARRRGGGSHAQQQHRDFRSRGCRPRASPAATPDGGRVRSARAPRRGPHDPALRRRRANRRTTSTSEPRRRGLRDADRGAGRAIITFLVYLNDDYDGGETDFPRIGVRHRGRRRGGLFFTNALPNGKPDHRMVHAGLPPTRGEKRIVSQFFRSRVAFNRAPRTWADRNVRFDFTDIKISSVVIMQR